MRVYLFLIAVTAWIMPSMYVFAAVQISEIAWMGTVESSYCEWVELYNDTAEEVDLSGWGIYEGRATPEEDVLILSLTKKIAPNDYYVIERTTPSSCPDPVPGLDDIGSFKGNGLSDQGEIVILLDADGNEIHRVDGSDKWKLGVEGEQVGDSATKATMQWDGSMWITGAPTPRAPAGAPQETVVNDDDTATPVESTIFDPPQPPNEKEYTLELVGPAYAAAGTSVQLKARGVPEEQYEHAWAFGDGAATHGERVWHTYSYSGTYAPVVRARRSGKEYMAHASIKIFTPDITISHVDSSRVEIVNNSAYPIELYQWTLRDQKNSFVFPRDTVVLPGAQISFPVHITGITANGSVVLLRPDTVEVARIERIVVETRSDVLLPDATSEEIVAYATQEVQRLAVEIEERRVPLIMHVPDAESAVGAEENTVVEVAIAPAPLFEVDLVSDIELPPVLVGKESKQNASISTTIIKGTIYNTTPE
ncbi:MAG: lamin tail domain-containing protein [bacterium]|nr:lamin tail domain-containing protein [bacterium]